MMRGVLSLSLCCCRAEDGTNWFAQMRLVFTADVNGSREQVPLVYVRWLTAIDTEQGGAIDTEQGGAIDTEQSGPLRMQRLKWNVTTTRPMGPPEPHFDVIRADRIVRPVFLQPDPFSPRNRPAMQKFYYNHFVK